MVVKPLPRRTEGEGKFSFFQRHASQASGCGFLIYYIINSSPLLENMESWSGLILPSPALDLWVNHPIQTDQRWKHRPPRQMSGAGQDCSVSRASPRRANSGMGLFQAQEEKGGQPGVWEVSCVRDGWQEITGRTNVGKPTWGAEGWQGGNRKWHPASPRMTSLLASGSI